MYLLFRPVCVCVCVCVKLGLIVRVFENMKQGRIFRSKREEVKRRKRQLNNGELRKFKIRNRIRMKNRKLLR
jgi:hypothetical protein